MEKNLPSKDANLHEVLSADEAFGAQRVDQGAGVLLVLVGAVQGAHDDLTQHLRQEVLGGLHLAHAAHGVGQVLAVQVLGGDPLLRGRRPISKRCANLATMSTVDLTGVGIAGFLTIQFQESRAIGCS